MRRLWRMGREQQQGEMGVDRTTSTKIFTKNQENNFIEKHWQENILQVKGYLGDFNYQCKQELRSTYKYYSKKHPSVWTIPYMGMVSTVPGGDPYNIFVITNMCTEIVKKVIM